MAGPAPELQRRLEAGAGGSCRQRQQAVHHRQEGPDYLLFTHECEMSIIVRASN